MTPRGTPKWRDTHVEVRGPARSTSKRRSTRTGSKPAASSSRTSCRTSHASSGPARSIVVWSSPEGGANALKLLYLLSLAAARESHRHPVALPHHRRIDAVEPAEARQRGVRVRMLVEGDITDAKPVKFASRAPYERLLEAGHRDLRVPAGDDAHQGGDRRRHAQHRRVGQLRQPIVRAERRAERRRCSIGSWRRGCVRTSSSDLGRSKRLDSGDVAIAARCYIRAREKMWSLFGEVF